MPPRRRLTRALAAGAVLAAVITAGGLLGPPAEAAAPRYGFGQMVNYPLVFPAAEPHVLGGRTHFWDQRYNGIHHAQDIMAPKMTEVYAVADGTVTWVGSTCCTLTITHDDGWESHYIHLNNDTPGTDDGQGWGIAPGIERWSRVERGQLIGWVGDSGNAEGTSPHLHFELWASDGVAVDSFVSLQEAEAAQGFTCAGEKATRVDTNGDHRITGTPFSDVIVGTAQADEISGGAGNDVICGASGDDFLKGGPGDDRLVGGEGNDRLAGAGGADTLAGGAGDDDLSGGAGDDLLAGHAGEDRLRGGTGDDHLLGGPDRDRLVASAGNDTLNGGRGRDTVSFVPAAAGVAADLAAGFASGGVTATLVGFEIAHGSAHPDSLTGDDRRNTLLGRAGDDLLYGAGGNDRLVGGEGNDSLHGGPGDDWLDGGSGETDSADGGAGTDTCWAEALEDCEA